MSDRRIKIQIAIPATFAGLLLLSACSTVQENPNYQFSSKYEAPGAVMVADSTPPATQTEQAPIVSASNSQSASSPTEEAYNADSMIGTPGYAILLAEEAEHNAAQAPVQPAPIQSFPPQTPPRALRNGPREVTYDYAQNVIIDGAPAPSPAPVSVQNPVQSDAPQIASTPIMVPTTRTYVVKPGDTVYSLSRRLCAPITDVMAPNGIGSDFSIEIGQTLTLPASRC